MGVGDVEGVGARILFLKSSSGKAGESKSKREHSGELLLP
jgi:hypothetical protein